MARLFDALEQQLVILTDYYDANGDASVCIECFGIDTCDCQVATFWPIIQVIAKLRMELGL
jgi:hypothetical protein